MWRTELLAQISSTDVAEIDDLYAWLTADRELAAEVVGRGSPKYMGGLEVLDLVLTHAVAISSLAMSVVGFVNNRRKPERLTITRPDGAKLEIEGATESTAAEIEEFLRARQDPEEPT
ncbi:hypothetical protein ACFY36_34000 [Actinoplanes sp. NPDC000266]